jgi:superoxide dismutase, Cu-Zn family
MKIQRVFAGLTMMLPFCFPALAVSDVPENSGVRATATIAACAGGTTVSGFAILSERRSTEGVKLVDIAMTVRGLPPGRHAVHIHAVGRCTPVPTCTDAGGHFDPGPASNTSPDGNHPFHSGDLINLDVNRRGFGTLQTTTSRITLSPGPLSLFDADGAAFIIHVAPDTYCPPNADGTVTPGCAGGARQACGVITLTP